jgi:hypothetical protein
MSDAVSLVCDSAYSILSIDYSAGTLTITVDFSEDLEARACNLTLTSSFIAARYRDSSLAFPAISNDIPLIVSYYLESYYSIETIFRILSYASLGLFVVSLGHKLIGAELLFCCQLVCLSNCLYRAPSFLFSSVK